MKCDWTKVVDQNQVFRVFAAFLLVALLAHTLHEEIDNLGILNNFLSDIADPYSESNAIRAGEGYCDQGFLFNKGLPDIAYGGRYPKQGNLGNRPPGAPRPKAAVYTHYPPGPDWLVGMMTCVCGKGEIGCFRILPVAIGMIGLVFFSMCAWLTFGPLLSVAVAFFLLVPAGMTNMMHGLHYQGYALTLLLMQLGALLLGFGTNKLSLKSMIAAQSVFGFVQGWLSFDYVFLVSLCAVPIGILVQSANKHAVSKSLSKDMFLCVFAAGCGFGAAHAIHFVQVVLFFGSLSRAVSDFSSAAALRASGAGWDAPAWFDKNSLAWSYLLTRYIFYAAKPVFFGSAFVFASLASLSAFLIPRRQLRMQYKRLCLQCEWTWSVHTYAGLIAAFLVSVIWILVMRHHAAIHIGFIPRHFALFYACCVFALVSATRVRVTFTNPLSTQLPNRQ